jgi:hypothetical protein
MIDCAGRKECALVNNAHSGEKSSNRRNKTPALTFSKAIPGIAEGRDQEKINSC